MQKVLWVKAMDDPEIQYLANEQEVWTFEGVHDYKKSKFSQWLVIVHC